MKHQYNLVAEDDENFLQHWENLTTMKKYQSNLSLFYVDKLKRREHQEDSSDWMVAYIYTENFKCSMSL